MDELALGAIAAEPPCVAPDQVTAAVLRDFGLAGSLEPLVSERDQNFLLRTPDGGRFVVKVTSATEPREVSLFHVEALRYLQDKDAVATPRVARTTGGELVGTIRQGGVQHLLRVVSFVEGAPLSGAEMTPQLAASFGAQLASLDLALQGFSHEGDRPDLLWDLQRASELRDLLHFIDDPVIAERVESAIDDFEDKVRPHVDSMRRQVIHGDANPGNVLLDPAGREVSGFIDFGDALSAPLVFDAAIAASYLRAAEGDPLSLLLPFVAAYQEVLPLSEDELASMFDLVRTRLATTITILYWRLASREESDPYRQKTLQAEAAAIDFLGALDALGADAFLDSLLRSSGAKTLYM